jgi:DNA mismatch endonuclease, patch repair protein
MSRSRQKPPDCHHLLPRHCVTGTRPSYAVATVSAYGYPINAVMAATRILKPSFRSFRPATSRASEAARGSSKKQNTRCELVLRRALTALGLRYRIDAASLAGRPDIIFRGVRVVVFCDGDYWHGRDLEKRLKKLSMGHNATYWVTKIRSNVERDRRVTAALEADGWMVLRYWETDIHKDVTSVASEIAACIRERQKLRW